MKVDSLMYILSVLAECSWVHVDVDGRLVDVELNDREVEQVSRWVGVDVDEK